MNDYKVVWEIDISADSPEEAVKEALEIQRDISSEATMFEVYQNNQLVSTIDAENV